VYGAVGGGIGFDVVAKVVEEGIAHHEEAAVPGERGEADEHPFVLEGGDAVADGLDSAGGNDGADDGAELFQAGAGGFRDRGEVIVDGGGDGGGGSRLLHGLRGDR